MSIFLSEASFLFIISDYIPMSVWASFFLFPFVIFCSRIYAKRNKKRASATTTTTLRMLSKPLKQI